jgi:hypothetical protein
MERCVYRRLRMNDPATRALWLAITIIAATLVGALAALLSWASGGSVPGALLVGGGAFAGTVLLVLTAIKFVTDRGAA